MKSKLLLLSILLLSLGCTNSSYIIDLKLIPIKPKGVTDNKNKAISKHLNLAIRQSQHEDIVDWKKVRVLYNEYEEEIILKNPNIVSDKKIVLLKEEAILVSDILKVLNFNSEIEFFNSLKKILVRGNSFAIYPYKENNTTFEHIYGIVLSEQNTTKKITKKMEEN